MIKVKVTDKGESAPKKIAKTIHVYSNDPNNRKTELKIRGTITPLFKIEPSPVILRGEAGKPISSVVKLMPLTEPPMEVSSVEARHGTFIRQRLEKIQIDNKTAYVLTVVNEKKTPGRYFDTILVQIDKDGTSPLTIPVTGQIH